MTKYVRWYVNVNRWSPTKDEWLSLTSRIADDELVRINKFVFRDDAKSSLIGQVLIRNFVSQAIQKPSNNVQFIRTTHGRPQVCGDYRKSLGKSWPKAIDFNVSHSGDYCVLAGFWSYEDSPISSIGVDVTQIVKKQTKQELDRFLSLMSRREFTPFEWKAVSDVPSDEQKCINFTRLWCLKECYIKAIGLGLSFKLSRIEFHPANETRYSLCLQSLQNNIISSTKVLLDGCLATDWIFQETALDNHLIAIGYNLSSPLNEVSIDQVPFSEVSIVDLIESLTPLNEPIGENWDKFISRDDKIKL